MLSEILIVLYLFNLLSEYSVFTIKQIITFLSQTPLFLSVCPYVSSDICPSLFYSVLLKWFKVHDDVIAIHLLLILLLQQVKQTELVQTWYVRGTWTPVTRTSDWNTSSRPPIMSPLMTSSTPLASSTGRSGRRRKAYAFSAIDKWNTKWSTGTV